MTVNDLMENMRDLCKQGLGRADVYVKADGVSILENIKKIRVEDGAVILEIDAPGEPDGCTTSYVVGE